MATNNFDYVEVHVGNSPDFIPTPDTLKDYITSTGGKQIAVPPGDNYFVKFVGVTKTNEKSDPSDVSESSSGQLVTSDIPDAIIQDTMVSDVSAGKLSDGTLAATVLMGGTAAITTNSGTAHVEYTENGLRAYNASGQETVGIYPDGNASFSGSIFGGTIDIPGAAVFSGKPGRLHVDDTGVYVILNGVVNLATNPSFEKATSGVPNGVTGVSATVTQSKGPRVSSFKTNPDYKVKAGNYCLKVVSSANNGTAKLDMINLQPSTTYTISFYTAVGEAVEDDITNLFQAVYTNPTLFKVVENGGSNRTLKSQLDGGIITEGSFLGLPISVDYTSSTPVQLGLTSFNFRFYASFTTPSDLVSGGAVSVYLPGGLKSDGTYDNTKAMFYDALQIEASNYYSKYCDGDQQDCTWSATAHASASSRGIVSPFAFRYTEGLQVQGKIIADDIEVRGSLKLGSGTPHASNYVSLYRSTTDALNSGSTATWYDLLWDSVASGNRLSSDDGNSITSDFKNFIANKEGLFLLNASITVPSYTSAYSLIMQVIDSDLGTVFASTNISVPANTTFPATLSWTGYMAANSKIKLRVKKNITDNITLGADASDSPRKIFFYQLL